MKRLIDCHASDLKNMPSSELKLSIKACEGRVILSETIVSQESVPYDLSNPELAAALGADIILLNKMDIFNPEVAGLKLKDLPFVSANVVEALKKLCGRLLAVNLEPVDDSISLMEEKENIVDGRKASKETFQEAEKLGFDLLCLTGNPAIGVSNQAIFEAIKLAKQNFSGLIIAGKMHASGISENLLDLDIINSYIEAGADIILLPAVGTIPGIDASELKKCVEFVHNKNVLVMASIGTSQESADSDTIRQIALMNKICGFDIFHTGDGAVAGMTPYQNILQLSRTIRGDRHTLRRMASGANR